MYYWTHTQNHTPLITPDVNKMTPTWPPVQQHEEETKPGLKYTEAGTVDSLIAVQHTCTLTVKLALKEHKYK